MINKLIKKIWFICLWFASLALVGCFHVPDKDWLLNNWETELNTDENNDLSHAFDSFIDDFNTISNQRTEIENDKNNWIENENIEKISIDTWDVVIRDENVIDEENVIEKEENDKK